MQSNKKSKIEKKKGAKIKASPKKKKEVSEESFSQVKKLISKFLTNLCEKNYSNAHKDLEQVIEAKIKHQIGKVAKDNKNKKNNKKGSE